MNFSQSYFLRLVASFFFYSLTANTAFGQQDIELYHNLQLRHIFENLNAPTPQREFLYDMSVHGVDTNKFSVYYDTIANDTNNAHIWVAQYNEVRYMAYDTNKVIPALEYAEDAYDFIIDSNKAPIGILHFQYNRFKEDALTTDNYFEFDIDNNTLYDLPNAPMPYNILTAFSSSAMAYQVKGLEPTFILDKKWFLLDKFTDSYYSVPGYEYEIDFGDGNGIQTFPAHLKHEISPQYPTSGEKIISISLKSVFCDVEVIYQTHFRIFVSETPPTIPPDLIITRTGLDVGIYGPCEVEGNSGRKIAIVVEGFDIFENEPPEKTYGRVLEDTRISDLRNFGYEFHVIDWHLSKAGMVANANNLKLYMDELKCELINSGNFEPMVIIGHSMGGIVARYALTEWEDDPTFSQCEQDYLHFTRLLITMDSPHQGANVPLAYQHYYKNAEWLLRMKLFGIIDFWQSRKMYTRLLNSPAAMQLLMYHVDTESGMDYTMSLPRQVFMDDLNSMGGYPSFCKVVATSSGSAIGINQENPFTQTQRTHGDKLLQIDGIAYARILFTVLPLAFVDLKMETADASNNEVFRSFGSQYLYKLTLKLWSLQIKLDKTLSPLLSYKADVHPYDVASGGYFGLNFSGFKPGFNNHSWPSSSFPLLHAFTWSSSLGPGKWRVGAEGGFAFIVGIGGYAVVESDGFGFNFVPLRSALDYGGDIYSGTQSPVLEGTPSATVMSNTPMDVVLAVPERAQNPQTLLFNYNHSNLYNPRLFWKYNPVPDPIYYRSCSTASILKYSRLLNREIGDEKLYLENFFQLFPQAHYRTEYDIYVNERNPAYQYPNFIDPDLHEPGAFSDEEIFELGEGRADFFSDQSEAQNFTGRDWSDGFLYNPPQEPLPQWDDWDEPYFICCGDY